MAARAGPGRTSSRSSLPPLTDVWPFLPLAAVDTRVQVRVCTSPRCARLGAGSSAQPFEGLLSDHASLPTPESQLLVSTIPSTPESQQGPPILIWGRPGKASGGLVWESSGPAHWPSLTGRCHTVCSDREPGGMSRPHGNPSLPGYAGLGPGAPGRGRGPRKWHPNVLGQPLAAARCLTSVPGNRPHRASCPGARWRGGARTRKAGSGAEPRAVRGSALGSDAGSPGSRAILDQPPPSPDPSVPVSNNDDQNPIAAS